MTLLLDVYNELTGGKQQSLGFENEVKSKAENIRKFVSKKFVKVHVSIEEENAHANMLLSMKKNTW